MAKPDLNDGFLRIAHELASALASSDFTKGAQIVMNEVFSQIFGPALRKTAKVVPHELVRRHGLDKSNVRRSVRELLSSGVLVEVEPMEYRFLKDYESWTKNGIRRLTEIEIAAARNAPKIAMGHKYGVVVNPDNSDPSETQVLVVNLDNLADSDQQTSVVRLDNSRITDANTSVVNSDNLSCQSRQPEQCPPLEPPIDDRVRPENGDLIKGSSSKSVTTTPSEKILETTREPEYPAPDTSMWMIHPGLYPENELAARRIWTHLWRTWKSPRLCTEFYEHQRWHKPDSWMEAIREAVRRGSTPRGIKFLESIAADVDANGPKNRSPVVATIKLRNDPAPPSRNEVQFGDIDAAFSEHDPVRRQKAQ